MQGPVPGPVLTCHKSCPCPLVSARACRQTKRVSSSEGTSLQYSHDRQLPLKFGCLPCAVGKQPSIPMINHGRKWTLRWRWWWTQQIRLPAICQAPCASTVGSKRRPWICTPSIGCLLYRCTSPPFRGNWSQLFSNKQMKNYLIKKIPWLQNKRIEYQLRDGI